MSESKSAREILEESSSFRPSLEKEKIVFEDRVLVDEFDFDTGIIVSSNLNSIIGKRVRVTIEEIEE